MNVNLELTDHCNIKCRMCSQSLRDEAHGAKPAFMDFDTWRRAILGLRGLENVSLCPHWLGEPLLHPEFDRFAEYAFAANRNNALFRYFKVHTNAVILPPDRTDLVLRLAATPSLAPDTFLAIHFSIDAFFTATYAFVKGADRREIVYRNVERFLRARGTATRPVAHLAFVVQEGNHREVQAFVDHWGGLLTELGRPWNLTGEWPPMDADAVYLRRLNTGDQPGADAIHAQACRAVGIAPQRRADGSF